MTEEDAAPDDTESLKADALPAMVAVWAALEPDNTEPIGASESAVDRNHSHRHTTEKMRTRCNTERSVDRSRKEKDCHPDTGKATDMKDTTDTSGMTDT